MIEPLKILDTFAGIGGFSYAAHKLVGGLKPPVAAIPLQRVYDLYYK